MIMGFTYEYTYQDVNT